MLKRSFLRLVVVFAIAASLLVGTSGVANAGRWCWRIGFPTPIPDVYTCIPTDL